MSSYFLDTTPGIRGASFSLRRTSVRLAGVGLKPSATDVQLFPGHYTRNSWCKLQLAEDFSPTRGSRAKAVCNRCPVISRTLHQEFVVQASACGGLQSDSRESG